MISLLLCLFMLLISSLGMNCTATNESQLDRASVGTASMDNATAGAEIVDYVQMNISSQESSENAGAWRDTIGFNCLELAVYCKRTRPLRTCYCQRSSPSILEGCRYRGG